MRRVEAGDRVRRSAAALGSIAWFVLTAGTFAGVIPWLLTGWRIHHPLPYWAVAETVGGVLICAGLIPIVHAFVQFAEAGGTPFPPAPTRRLVVGGFHRYVRNPIYLGGVVVLLGEALLFGRLNLLVYAVAAWGLAAVFVRRYEEPTLARRFGAEYEAYRRAVPAWRPRLRPWSPG